MEINLEGQRRGKPKRWMDRISQNYLVEVKNTWGTELYRVVEHGWLTTYNWEQKVKKKK